MYLLNCRYHDLQKDIYSMLFQLNDDLFILMLKISVLIAVESHLCLAKRLDLV